MYSPTDRKRLSERLIAAAHADDRIQGVAVTGSGAVDSTDAWSDIDVAFGLRPGVDRTETVDDWTRRMYRDHRAVHHTDVMARNTVYRVFLLADTLQVDIAFAPDGEFGPTASTFRLLSGTAMPQPAPPAPKAEALVGMAWLHGLHVRSSLARGRPWQADYMLSGMRNQVVALACLRHGLPSQQGRGADRLPSDALDPGMIPTVASIDGMNRAFARTIDALLREVDEVDTALGGRLRPCLRELAGEAPQSLNPGGGQTVDNG